MYELKGIFCAFYCEAFDLPLDSEIKIFRQNFLGMIKITTLNIPKSVEELEDGWCGCTFALSEIIISSENKHFKYLDSDRKMIVGKSNKNEEKFDEFHFVSPKIEKVFIPSFKFNIIEFISIKSIATIRNLPFWSSSL